MADVYVTDVDIQRAFDEAVVYVRREPVLVVVPYASAEEADAAVAVGGPFSAPSVYSELARGLVGR